MHRGGESSEVHQEVSDINVEGPPVPIPNTEVKLNSAEDTRMEASRENRSLLTQRQDFKVLSHKEI